MSLARRASQDQTCVWSDSKCHRRSVVMYDALVKLCAL